MKLKRYSIYVKSDNLTFPVWEESRLFKFSAKARCDELNRMLSKSPRLRDEYKYVIFDRKEEVWL